MVRIQAGTRLRSAVCETQVMVIRCAMGELDITCGGWPMLSLDAPAGADGAELVSSEAAGTLLGKRYVNEGGDLELLCTKPGKGSIAVAGTILTVKSAKQLPSSD